MRKLGVLFLCVLCIFANAAALADASVSEKVVLTGKKIQGGLVFGKVPVGSRVSLNGKPLNLTDEGDFVMGFDRDTPSGDVLEVIFPDGQVEKQILQIVTRQYDVQRVNGISAEIQSDQKSAETWERIRLEQLAVDTARAQLLPITAFKQTFKWPVIGPVSGVFGSQRVYNGEPGRPHYGVDVAVPTGTRVYAPADGIVTLAYKDMYYSGGTIILDHGFGLSSSFLHLGKVLVKAGDVIKQGDVLAESGATGRASGPHLDWRMNWLDRRVDVQLLVPPMPDHNRSKGKTKNN